MEVGRGPESNKLSRLARFVRLLERKIGYRFNINEEFEDRLKLQKYVFLARFFGYDMGYDFSLYYYGPYSPSLADDYFELADWVVKPDVEDVSWERENDFLELVRGKNSRWLELAATIMSVYEGNRGKVTMSELIGIVKLLKKWAEETEIKGIVEELIRAGLIKLS